MPRFIRGEGNPRAKLMVVGDFPGTYDIERGRCFSGPSGDMLDQLLESAGTSRSQCYLTTLRKYQPPLNWWGNWSPDEPLLEKQLEILQEEIEAIKPNVILALGDNVLYYLTHKSKIHKWRGSILTHYNGIPKVVGTFHPKDLSRSKDDTDGTGAFTYAYKHVMRLDFQRAVQQSRYPDLRLPERHLQICRSSIDLQRFIDRNDRKRPLSVDIESSRCIPVCIGLSFDRSEAISIPLFNRLSHVNYDGIGTQELAYIWKDLAEILHDSNIIGQNYKYDNAKLYSLGFKKTKIYGDTQLLAHTINPEMPRKSMAFLQSIYTEEPYHKEEGGDFLGEVKKKGVGAKGNLDTLMLYNAKDAAVTTELHEEMLEEAREKGLEEYYFRCVVPRHEFYLKMERTGFLVDFNKRAALLDKYMQMYEIVHRNTTETLGYELNVSSPKQVAKTLYYDLKLPLRLKRKKHPLEKDTPATDEDTITALLANQAKTDQQKIVCNNLLNERKIRKTVSTYILAPTDYDGRMRTSYNITGAETDRTSTSNISAPIRPEKSMGLGFQTLTKHGDIGSDICEMFIPDPGMVFVNADLSQAEARVVFVLANEWDVLTRLDDPKYDMHWQTALWIFNELPRTAEECKSQLSKEDSRRHIGKTTRHAGHLGATKKMLMQTINTDAKKAGLDLYVSEWRAGVFLDGFHQKAPNIRGVFHKGVENALNDTRILEGPTLIGPDGKKLPRGRYRMFFDRWSPELLKEAYAEIPQHTVSNQTKFAGMRIMRRLPDLQFILEGHDALLVQVPKNDVEAVARIMKEEMETPIDFSSCSLKRDFQLVIPAEFQIGERDYKHLEKLKVA